MALMFEPLRKYATFQGRARRAEYWPYVLVMGLVEFILAVMAGAYSEEPDPFGTLIFGVFLLGTFLPSLAVSVRRLHDVNRSGWWFLISLVPILGLVVLLVFTVRAGTPGPNRYGPDPKDREPAMSAAPA